MILITRSDGPSLYKITKGERKLLFREKLKTPVEYKLELRRDRDPDSVADFQSLVMERKISQEHLHGNKFGGTPAIMYDIPFSAELTWTDNSSKEVGEWKFAMQLDQDIALFNIEFEPTAVGYFFVSKDFKKGWLEFHA